jgi:hypothetical protein
MSFILLNIKGISYSQSKNGAYVLVLNEVGGHRTLPIIIGAFEAQSIAISLERSINPPRPITHDLFKNFADRFGVTVKKVVIHKLENGIFYSSLHCEKDDVEEVIEARTSDAIAIATRFKSPIFTYQSILESAGVYIGNARIKQLQKKTQQSVSHQQKSLNQLTLKELEDLLETALENEDYEMAAKIRDEISKRN